MDNMENKTNETELTKANKGQGVVLSTADAEEYYAYKKQQKISQIMAALAKSEGAVTAKGDVQKVVEQAMRIHQAAVRVTPTRFAQTKNIFPKGKIRVDCIIGGDGETLSRVKAYEAKLARRLGAEELTVVLAPTLLESCRYTEIKRELRRVKRASGKAHVKVWVDKGYPYATLARVARICSELGVRYLSVPYFTGCEKLRFDMCGGCRLEVVGIETLSDFKKMIGMGVGRIVTTRGFDIYTQWMKEAESIRCAPEKAMPTPTETPWKQGEKKEEEKQPAVKNPETDYRCRLEGTELKFL